jgi:hypothetical protein
MMPRRILLLFLVVSAIATSLRAQLMDLSFDVGIRFRNDYVDTERYFRLEEGSAAHFDFRFDPDRPHAGNDFVRIRVTEPDGGIVFNEHRALDRVGRDDQRYFLGFTRIKSDEPIDRRFYENFVFEMSMSEGWVDEFGTFMPPDVQIDPYSELYVYGWTPMIQYVPQGYGGSFRFDEVPSNVTLRFVPVPEPSTYGLVALAMLGVAAGWRRWRA